MNTKQLHLDCTIVMEFYLNRLHALQTDVYSTTWTTNEMRRLVNANSQQYQQVSNTVNRCRQCVQIFIHRKVSLVFGM